MMDKTRDVSEMRTRRKQRICDILRSLGCQTTSLIYRSKRKPPVKLPPNDKVKPTKLAMSVLVKISKYLLPFIF